MIKIGGTDPHYRIFGSWYGGYAGSYSWRLNSGVKSVEEDENYYYFYGSTGSCYQCHKESYGANSYGWSVVTGMKDDDRFEIMEEPENVMEMDWII